VTLVYYKLFLDPNLCIGCRLCEAVCSLKNEGKIMTKKAKVNIRNDYLTGRSNIAVCVQCDRPPCIDVCRRKALKKEELPYARVLVIDSALCNNCAKCIACCLVNAIKLTDEGPIVCDLCSGDPLCAKICPTKAIRFERAIDVQYEKLKLRAHAFIIPEVF